jgi:TolB-like protein
LLLLLGLGAVLLRLGPHEKEDIATIHSLAVLPLENLSNNAEQEYFVDGLTEELITSIAKVSQLRVISRTSVMHYKGARRPIAEIAQELNFDGIVEGTVLRSGDRVRITAQLIETRTDKHLWGETYCGDMRDILALQTEVANAIASEVRIKVVPQRIEGTHQVNSEAYESYLKGRSYADRLTTASRGTATKYYEHAIELDPNSALAVVVTRDFA